MRNAALIASFGSRHISAEDLTPDSLADCEVVAVDVDVEALPNVRRLRSALSGRRNDCLKIFAIDTTRRIEIVYANIIGAMEAMRRPFDPASLEARIAAHRRRRTPVDDGTTAASISAAAGAVGEMFEALMSEKAIDMPNVLEAGSQVIDAIGDAGFATWVDVVRKHHEGTFQHCLIVTGLASSFGKSAGMSRRDVMTLTTAALVHDIGKAAVPVSILDKSGKLTDEEFAIIQQHPGRGYEHLKRHASLDDAVLAAVRGHHEYLDGSGYPDHLSAATIGDVTRILTICDVYGAMIERRAYKPPARPDEALGVLENLAEQGKLETALVRAFRAAV